MLDDRQCLLTSHATAQLWKTQRSEKFPKVGVVALEGRPRTGVSSVYSSLPRTPPTLIVRLLGPGLERLPETNLVVYSFHLTTNSSRVLVRTLSMPSNL
ncbi:hypothetical protein RRG08_017353 [Elysia crispata]|uniref:Uncharacterized protein n=1 Tax=Elysia crispata TaxID=231223 RepID=A0AAE1AKM6_9GAST|nr:hypothetical protein RRG08_017353 [Elysia crispata]